MERLVIPNKAGSLCYNDTDQGLKLEPNEITSHQRWLLLERLHEYEDTGLTPEQIRELKEAIRKLKGNFGDAITVNQVIDFFVDFYNAQRDPDRVEAAELLTNEDVTRYRELKERDTAKAPKEVSEEYGYFECPSCGDAIYASDNFESHKFCLNCGQRLEWED